MQTFKISEFIPEWLRSIFRFSNDGFYFRNSYLLGQKGAIWIDTLKPRELYYMIPQLRTVIDRKAQMFSNMDLKLYDIKAEKEIEAPELHLLLQNPNALQNLNQFLQSYKLQEQIYGNQFIYKNKPSRLSSYPSTLTNVSPYYMTPVLTGKYFDQVAIEGIISSYKFVNSVDAQTFDAKDILFTRIEDIDNPIIGLSPLMSLKFPLTNTKLAYEYRNVIMGEKGAIGMITNKGKDSIGSVALTTEEKKSLQDQYVNNFGIKEGQSRVHVSGSDLDWKPFGYPTKELMLFEEVDANLLTIVDHFGLNINIFSNKNATFENVKNAIIQCYQDTIIPEADRFTQALGKFLNIPPGTRLIASFDHLSILQENNQKGMLAIQAIVTALTQSVAAGILAAPQAAKILKNELATQLGEV